MTIPSQHPIDYAYYFPWTRLFRSFRIATDPRKILLAAVGLVLMWSGDAAISQLPLEEKATPLPPWQVTQPQSLIRWSPSSSTLYDAPYSGLFSLGRRLTAVVEPIADLATLPFENGPSTWGRIASIWSRFLWAAIVWSLFGGAIARLAAVEFARDQRGELLQSLQFAGRRFLSFFAAPLLPIAAVLLIWGMAAFGGLVGRVPVVGEWLAAAAWGVALCLGLIAVLIVIATVAGWPLMIAAIAAENSDAFDGFSRSFSYLFSRPWLSAWLAAVGLVLGIFFTALVDTLAVGVTAGTAHMVSTGMGDAGVGELHRSPVAYFGDSNGYPFEADSTGSRAAVLVRIWLGVVAMVAVGFAASFFWTAATICYFLLRRAEDATLFDEVWLSEVEEDDGLLPLAGIAATSPTPIERPHQPVVESNAEA